MSTALPPSRDFIGGRFEAPTDVLEGFLCDSNTGEVLAPRVASARGAVERALDVAAGDSARAWQSASAETRAAALARVADALDARLDAMAHADARTTGVLVGLTRMFAAIAQSAFRGAGTIALERAQPLELAGPAGAVEVHRLPLGPAAVIAPWNAPSVIAAHKVASALAAGCPVVLKPSEIAPTSCELLAGAIAEADLPAGAFQLVHGGAEVGAALVADPRIQVVSFTGGLVGGRAVAAACARDMKPAQLELGGNNPLVVLAGADVEAAADAALAGLTTMSGQWCRALGRIICHDSLLEPLVVALEARLSELRIGSSLDPASEMGPLAHPDHHTAVSGAVDALRARGGGVLAPSALPALDGWFFAPAIVSVPPHLAADEIFGPVATLHSFTDDAEAIATANGTRFGLAAYVFGPEPRAREVGMAMQAGVVKLNGLGLLGLHPRAPRPAWGLSGLGDEGAVETFEHFRGSRVIGAAGTPGGAR